MVEIAKVCIRYSQDNIHSYTILYFCSRFEARRAIVSLIACNHAHCIFTGVRFYFKFPVEGCSRAGESSNKYKYFGQRTCLFSFMIQIYYGIN